MKPVLFTNVTVWTAGQVPFQGEVLVESGRISKTASGARQIAAEGAEIIDGAGATLMPGLMDGHGHLAFPELPNIVAWGLIPPEEHTLITMHNARRVLDAGFTSVLSAGSVKPRLDVVIRDEINSGRIPGPRILASTPEFTVTGGLGDDRRLHADIQTFCLVIDGADEFRRMTRLHCREGADVLKICISGHQPLPGARHASAESTLVSDAELGAFVETVRSFGKVSAAHARSDGAVVMALRHGIDVLYHCEYANGKTLDLLEQAKDRIVLAPAVAPFVRSLEDAEKAGQSNQMSALRRQFEHICETYQELRRRGLRVMIGGEYGHPHCPHGTNARDMEYFVRLFGYSPAEVLECTTTHVAAGMRMGSELGRVKEGFVADLLLVEGRPYNDVSILQNKENISAIMQSGRFYKRSAPELRSSIRAA